MPIVPPQIGAPDITEHTGFILAEDEALKKYLSGIVVPNRPGSAETTEVGVWFRFPEGERQIKYPFITLDLLSVEPAYDLFTSVFGEDPNGLYQPSVSPSLPPPGPGMTHGYIPNYLPFRLVYQVMVHSRSSLHDRYLLSLFMTDVVPPRPFWLAVDADNTWRRIERVGFAQADIPETTESGTKRIFRKVHTLSMLAEIPQGPFIQTYPVLRVFLSVVDRVWVDVYFDAILDGQPNPLNDFTKGERAAKGEYNTSWHESRVVPSATLSEAPPEELMSDILALTVYGVTNHSLDFDLAQQVAEDIAPTGVAEAPAADVLRAYDAAVLALTEPPPAGDWPDATNTGPRIALTTYSGNYEFRTDGQTVTGMLFNLDDTHNGVYVDADGVSFVDCKFVFDGTLDGGFAMALLSDNSNGTTFDHCEFDGGDRIARAIAQGPDVTATACHMHNVGNGVESLKMHVEDCYMHDIWEPPGTDWHADGVQSWMGTDDIVIRHNTIITAIPATSCINIEGTVADPAERVLIENNLLAGGSYTVYAGPGGATAGNEYIIRNNHFSKQVYDTYGDFAPVAFDEGRGGVIIEGNVDHETGEALDI